MNLPQSSALAKLVFITGASSGLGQALASRYYRAGWRLALAVRRPAELEAWALEQGFAADRYAIYGADVADSGSIIGAGNACLTRQGVPDVVIANAGISIGVDTTVREDIDVIAQTFAINNVGLAATFHPFILPMSARGSGVLVGIGSVAGIRGLPGHAAYCASKAAAISYCESLRGELRANGVHVATICPGYVDTPMTRQNRYSMPFLMRPEDFAEAAFRAIEARISYRVIPWQMGVVAKLLRLLPNTWFDKVMAGRPRKQRQAAR